MRKKSSRSIGPTQFATEIFGTFLEARGGEESVRRGQSISLREDRLASRSALPDDGAATKTPDGSGLNCSASFAYFDHAICSWKTPQVSFLPGLDTYSQSWPSSGMLRIGRAYRQPPLVRRICDGGFSLSPTPRPCSGKRSSGANRTELMEFWLPIPRAADGSHGARVTSRKSKNGGNPIEALSALMFPTPTTSSRNNCGGSNSRSIAHEQGVSIGRKLSSDFVEWMQGLPISWTELQVPSATSSPTE